LALCIENGIQKSLSSSDYWTISGDTSTMRLGQAFSGGATQFPLNGDIYAIRIYNRRLTSEEMLNNQILDNQRFGLGLTF
jgi:hypothetical protein